MKKNKKVKFAIIVPCPSIDEYTIDCVKKSLKQTITDFEIIIVPDNAVSRKFIIKTFGEKNAKKIKCIFSGVDLPSGIISAKRNIAIKNTSAEFIAFVDSDAYPSPDWLESVIPILSDTKIGIVGGPTLVPRGVGVWEKTIILTIPLYCVSTGLRYKLKKYIGYKIFDDVPACNLITKRKILVDSGFFDERCFTGEDTLFCRQVNKAGKLILFNDKTKVYHHNRPLFSHLKRMKMFGANKVRLLNELNIFPLFNIILALFSIYILLMVPLSFFIPNLSAIFFGLFLAYLIIISVDCMVNSINLVYLPFCVIIVFLTHLAYGVGSIEGFLFKKLNFRFNQF
jgi:GT2 family glycosyltransferase